MRGSVIHTQAVRLIDGKSPAPAGSIPPRPARSTHTSETHLPTTVDWPFVQERSQACQSVARSGRSASPLASTVRQTSTPPSQSHSPEENTPAALHENAVETSAASLHRSPAEPRSSHTPPPARPPQTR